jgi:peptide/histidine transporter 3/4
MCSLGTEFVEWLAYFAIAMNLVTYLTGELHESNVDAARNVSTWIGSCFLTPVIGAFLADTFWGTYMTIVVFLLVYTVVSCTKKVVIHIPIYRL